MIDGRAYLKDHTTKSFMLPCDDDEADRLMTLVSEMISSFDSYSCWLALYIENHVSVEFYIARSWITRVREKA
jgi:hypothetical protein